MAHDIYNVGKNLNFKAVSSKTIHTEAETVSSENKRVFDHAKLLKKCPNLRIKSVTIYGSNFVEAVSTEFFDPLAGTVRQTLHKGTKYTGMQEPKQKISLAHDEVIDRYAYKFIIIVI